LEKTEEAAKAELKDVEVKKEQMHERKTERLKEEGRVTFKGMHTCQAHSCLLQIGIPIQHTQTCIQLTPVDMMTVG